MLNCSWSQVEGKPKETVDRYHKDGLQTTEYTCNITRGNTHDTALESVESDHRWVADACYGIAWGLTKKSATYLQSTNDSTFYGFIMYSF